MNGVLGGQFWGPRRRDLRRELVKLSEKYGLTLSITGIEFHWFTKRVEFEVEGPDDALRDFQREALELVDG